MVPTAPALSMALAQKMSDRRCGSFQATEPAGERLATRALHEASHFGARFHVIAQRCWGGV